VITPDIAMNRSKSRRDWGVERGSRSYRMMAEERSGEEARRGSGRYRRLGFTGKLEDEKV